MDTQFYTGNCYIQHEHAGSGFSSIYLATLSAILSALDKDLKPYVNNNKSWFNPTYDFTLLDSLDKSINPWDWWFDQPPLDLELPPNQSYLDYVLIKHPPQDFLSFHSPEFLERCSKVIKEFAPLKEHIQTKIMPLK